MAREKIWQYWDFTDSGNSHISETRLVRLIKFTAQSLKAKSHSDNQLIIGKINIDMSFDKDQMSRPEMKKINPSILRFFQCSWADNSQ